jgi:membrane-bound ClpP family serine protease
MRTTPLTENLSRLCRPRPREAGQSCWQALAAILLAIFIPTSSRAEGQRNAGMVLPLTSARIKELGSSPDRLAQAIDKAFKRFQDERKQDAGQDGTFRLICDFNPDSGNTNASDSFGACYELAKQLRDLQNKGIQTVAFLHGNVSRHSVLPALACSEIVMSKEPASSLGKVAEPGKPLDATERLAYELITRGRFPLALIHKMHDADLVVIKVRPTVKTGDRYRDANEKPRVEGEPVPDLGRGVTAAYNFEQAREFNLCQREPRDDLNQVLLAYDMPRSALAQFPEQPIVWRMTLSGQVNGEMVERTKRHIKRALGNKANVLILTLDCGDGDSTSAHTLALFLARELNEKRADNPVETIAFVTPQARSTATFLALACDKIVMHPQAKLGDFGRFIQDNQSLEPFIRKNLAELAEMQHYSPVLAQGMLDKDLRIVWAASTRGDTEKRFLDEKQVNQEKGRWRTMEQVKPAREDDAGKYLTLDAATAKRYGVAYAIAENLEPIYAMVGVQPGDVHNVESDMLDQLAEFLRNPWTRLVLVMLGITCLILELKMPGASLPGVISAVCFVLFFWSHSQVGGQMTVLALLLFVLGLVLIGLEIFVLPGFGVCGISGIVLVIGSLGLVAYGQWPRSQEDWVGFAMTIGPMGISMMAAICLAFLLARYLPSIPLANRLMLKPAAEEGSDLVEEPSGPAINPELASLLGAIGVAATPLRPAGKTQFGDAFVDVVAEGNYVHAGARVQVIEIEGNRVVVKEV